MCARRGMVSVVAIGTSDASVGAVLVLARLCVLGVKGGEMGTGALVAHWEPGLAGIGSVAPFEARGTLSCGRGDGPGLASPDDTNE